METGGHYVPLLSSGALILHNNWSGSSTENHNTRMHINFQIHLMQNQMQCFVLEMDALVLIS